jgi:hypothetical protein
MALKPSGPEIQAFVREFNRKYPAKQEASMKPTYDELVVMLTALAIAADTHPMILSNKQMAHVDGVIAMAWAMLERTKIKDGED